MKRMNMLRSIGMTLVATVFISSLAFAQAGNVQPNRRDGAKQGGIDQKQDARVGRRGGDRELMGLGFFLGDLNLSDEQKAQMREKSREFQLASEESRLKLRFAQQDLGAVMRETPVDQAKVDGLWAEIAELRQAEAKVRVDQLLELKSILTEEQLTTLQTQENERQELQDLKAEFRELLLASGEADVATLQELQAKITEKELVFEKERVAKRAARRSDFVQNRVGRSGRKAVK